MPTRLMYVVIDARDHRALARWWSGALGWPVAYEDDDEADIDVPKGAGGVGLTIVAVADAGGPHRIHLDLPTSGDGEPDATRDRLVAAGAAPYDIGQGDVPWRILTDPEGNAFCVIEPRDDGGTGPISAIVVQARDPFAQSRFWAAASGWAVYREGERTVVLRAPDGRGPYLAFVRGDEPKTVKNRIHLDIAPYLGEDQPAEVERLVALGARPADVGQGPDVSWTVLTDPEGNEFCVLSPRDDET